MFNWSPILSSFFWDVLQQSFPERTILCNLKRHNSECMLHYLYLFTSELTFLRKQQLEWITTVTAHLTLLIATKKDDVDSNGDNDDDGHERWQCYKYSSDMTNNNASTMYDAKQTARRRYVWRRPVSNLHLRSTARFRPYCPFFNPTTHFSMTDSFFKFFF